MIKISSIKIDVVCKVVIVINDCNDVDDYDDKFDVIIFFNSKKEIIFNRINRDSFDVESIPIYDYSKLECIYGYSENDIQKIINAIKVLQGE